MKLVDLYKIPNPDGCADGDKNTKKYADEILAELEANLQDKPAVIKENRSELR